jgi:DNA polymerase-3 subunit epsilon
MKRLFFDLETTGTSTTKDRIVQFAGIIKFGDDTIDSMNIMLNPELPIEPGATEVHGITNEMVGGCSTFKQVAQDVLAFMQSADVICGFNILVFDIPLLAEEFTRAGIEWDATEKPIIDVYKIFVMKEQRTLQAAHKFYVGTEFDHAHDAIADVEATDRVFRGMMGKYEDLRVVMPSEIQKFCLGGKEMVDLSGKLGKNEKGEVVYAFGKAAGTPVLRDRGFGEWMLKNDFPTQTKQILRGILFGR